MRIEGGFTVGAPVDTVHAAMRDIEQAAECLRGFTVERASSDSVVRGSFRPARDDAEDIRCLVSVQDIDDDDHTVSLAVRARQSAGPGIAALTLTSRLRSVDRGATRVQIEVDLTTAGNARWFDGHAAEDALARHAAEFGTALEKRLRRNTPVSAGAVTMTEDDPGAKRDSLARLVSWTASRRRYLATSAIAGLALAVLLARKRTSAARTAPTTT
ncbi:hypothetical protein G3I59_37720 [Amycolatopsis rubida]|uniref:Carbon monoxide dehydrogenase subunit G n=1 Tax=Amycolatopsis rubida TaxID=112413 RepID=A0ABX0C4K0_9PSEU|nr:MULTISPECIES: hypothetical protein [Amycolatopsis]MYW96197.1 hypothetical protein [Amycolatopsis rubida]NEC61188.1 hypothetical protein [Amycolatopsis rubida]OAP24286.1 hypothetical protein A4R44_05059 [Amycolatopsis sp. M39]